MNDFTTQGVPAVDAQLVERLLKHRGRCSLYDDQRNRANTTITTNMMYRNPLTRNVPYLRGIHYLFVTLWKIDTPLPRGWEVSRE